MRARGTEGLDDPGTAEQARIDYRNVINERNKDPELPLRIASHGRIAEQAGADFEARQESPWRIVRGSQKLKERFAKKLRRQKRQTAKKSKT